MPAMRAIVRDAANTDHMSAFIMGVINSNAFKMGVTDTGKTEDARPTSRGQVSGARAECI